MRRIALSIGLVGVAAVAAAPASPAAVPSAVVVAAAASYHPVGREAVDLSDDPEVTIQQGTTIIFYNADPVAPHTLSALPDENGYVAFDSNGGEPTAMGKYSFVDGVENLAPGQYQFQCKLHTNLMHGWIKVVSRSTPV